VLPILSFAIRGDKVTSAAQSASKRAVAVEKAGWATPLEARQVQGFL